MPGLKAKLTFIDGSSKTIALGTPDQVTLAPVAQALVQKVEINIFEQVEDNFFNREIIDLVKPRTNIILPSVPGSNSEPIDLSVVNQIDTIKVMAPKTDVDEVMEAIASRVVCPIELVKGRNTKQVRGGFYTKKPRANYEYNNIIGIREEEYHEILAVMEIAYFGVAINEALRSRFAKKVETHLDNLQITLPASQKIKLICQLWLDLTSHKTTEDFLEERLSERRREYAQKYLDRLNGKQLSMKQWLKSKAINILSLGIVKMPPALPREV